MEISLILSSIFSAGKSYHFVKYHVGNAALSKGYKCVSVEKNITNTTLYSVNKTIDNSS